MKRSSTIAITLVLPTLLILGVAAAVYSRPDGDPVRLKFVTEAGEVVNVTAVITTSRLDSVEPVHVGVAKSTEDLILDVETVFGSDENVRLHLVALQQGALFQTSQEYHDEALSYVNAGVIPSQDGVVISRADVQDGELAVQLSDPVRVFGTATLADGSPYTSACAAYNGQGDSYRWVGGRFSIYMPSDDLHRDIFLHDILGDPRIIRIPSETVVNVMDTSLSEADVGTVVVTDLGPLQRVLVSFADFEIPAPERLGFESVYLIRHDGEVIMYAMVDEFVDGTLGSLCSLPPGQYFLASFPTGTPMNQIQYHAERQDPLLLIDFLGNQASWSGAHAGHPGLVSFVVPETSDLEVAFQVSLNHVEAKQRTRELVAAARAVDGQ